MKKIILVIAVFFAANVTFSNNSSTIGPLIIYTSCGTSYVMDDAGMSWDEIFDHSEMSDWIDCE